MGRLEGKIALVTGAASGIGRACAGMMAREGARVALTDIDLYGARAAADAIGPAAIALLHDVREEDSWQAALAAAGAAFGGLHILVNSAGGAVSGTVEDTSLDQWRALHALDLDSVFLGCKYAIAPIAAAGGGSIVNISSVSGIVAGHNLAAYNSAKAAVRHLSKSVALHCARAGNGIRCNSVHPAFVDTPLLDGILRHGTREEGLARLAAQIPLGIVGTAADVAHAVVYLASDESRFMTGSELVLDGGISAM